MLLTDFLERSLFADANIAKTILSKVSFENPSLSCDKKQFPGL